MDPEVEMAFIFAALDSVNAQLPNFLSSSDLPAMVDYSDILFILQLSRMDQVIPEISLKVINHLLELVIALHTDDEEGSPSGQLG